MIVLYILLFIVVLGSVRLLPYGTRFNEDYISKETSNIVKGIFIWIVFICHISGYISDSTSYSQLDNYGFYLNSYIRQLLVVAFLFYSGYGTTLSIKNKRGYGNKVLSRRVLPTIINFDVAVLFFLLVNTFLSIDLELKNILLAFTGWTSIGNSNWYIFCICICYTLSWIGYRIFGNTNMMIYFVFCGLLVYSIVLSFLDKGAYWYDTVYSYGLGCSFAWWKSNFENKLIKHYFLSLFFMIFSFLFFYNAPNYGSIPANLSGMFLCLIIVQLTMKFRLKALYSPGVVLIYFHCIFINEFQCFFYLSLVEAISFQNIDIYLLPYLLR